MSKTAQVRTYIPAEAAVFCKTNERFGGLSNMSAGFPLDINGISIRTSEALYQTCRFPHLPEVQRLIIDQRSPMTAKMKSKPYRGQSRQDWDSVRVRVMRWSLRVKLAQNWEPFGEILRSTGQLPIVELSYKDEFWGAKPNPDGLLVGMNVLGRLLMELRGDLLGESSEDLKQITPLAIENFLLCGNPIGIVTATKRTEIQVVQNELLSPKPAQEEVIGASSNSTVSTALATQQSANDTCYTRCLPLLLTALQAEDVGEKQLTTLAGTLDILPGQLKAWLNRAIREGRIEKRTKKRKQLYVPAVWNSDLPLPTTTEDAA